MGGEVKRSGVGMLGSEVVVVVKQAERLVRYTFERRIERHDIHDEPQRGSGGVDCESRGDSSWIRGGHDRATTTKRSQWVEEGCRWLTVSATGDVCFCGGGGGAKGGPNACKPMVRMEGADGERIESLQKPQRLETGVKEVKQG